jgi:hypothetical protein
MAKLIVEGEHRFIVKIQKLLRSFKKVTVTAEGVSEDSVDDESEDTQEAGSDETVKQPTKKSKKK